ncbi:MAG: hypothetical protein JNM85_01260 [Chthonomonas sp.]|nr:hypothetical protein [Chthonomonas sp.]
MFATLLGLLAAVHGWSLQGAEASLLPPEPLPLGGYTARQGAKFVPGGDDLRCRVRIVGEGSARVAFVNLEMLTVPESLVREVRARIGPDLPLFMGATHTHCAPDSQMLNERMNFDVPGIARFQRKWLNWVADRIAETINEAATAPRQVGLTGTIDVRRLTLNRGRRRLAQPSSLAVTFSFGGAKTISTYAAHATLYNETELRTRGDWPGEFMRMGAGLMFPASIGDVSPKSEGATAAERVHRMATALADVTGRHETQRLDDRLKVVSTPISLPAPAPHPDFARDYKVVDGIAKLVVNAFAPKEASLTGVRLGSWVLLGVPGEPSAELGRQLELMGRNRGFAGVVVVSHVNGWAGYMLLPEDYDRGGYEATLNFYGRDFSSRLIDAARRCFEALRTP